MIASETPDGRPYAEIHVAPERKLRVEIAPGGGEIRFSGETAVPIEFAGELVGAVVAVLLAAGRGAS